MIAWIGSKQEPSYTAKNDKPAFESRRVRTQPRTETSSPTATLPERISEIDGNLDIEYLKIILINF